MLRIPEDEQPPGREAEGADHHGDPGGPGDVAAEQLPNAGVAMAGGLLRLHPSLGFGHLPSDPEHEQRRHHADKKHIAFRRRMREQRQQPDDGRGEQDAEIDAGLQDGGEPRPPGFGPGFRHQRRAHGPLAADAERGHEAEDHQLPPGLRRGAQPGAAGVGEHREREGAAAAQQVAQPAEERAARGPADEEGGLDVGGLLLDRRVGRAGGGEQVDDQRRGDQGVEVQFESVEQPAEPGGDAGFPLQGGDLAQAGGLGHGGGRAHGAGE